MTYDPEILESLQHTIDQYDTVLFMKGTASFPQCGFSAKVVGILKELDVPFKAINVLDDPNIRQGIKDFSEWPTIPQLYYKGEFIGGCDIVSEMFESGELQDLLGLDGSPQEGAA